MELGLRFVEFDVHLAADRIPVVIHDHELRRTAGLPGTVFERPSALLRTIEAAERERFGERYAGVCIPLLSEVLDLLDAHPGVSAFVEIKRASLRQFGEEEVVSQILQVLEPMRERCIVISFDLPAIQRAREGGFRIGWVLTAYDDHAQLKCQALQPEFLFCNHEKLPPDGSRLWRGPWRWALYEVESAELAAALAARGATLIETMAVAPMAQALRPPSAG